MARDIVKEKSAARFIAFFAIFSTLLLGWSLPVLAENWQSLGRGTQRQTGVGMEVFIDLDSVDLDSVKRLGNAVEFSKKTIFDSKYTTSTGITYIKLIVTVIIDCARRTSAIVTAMGYDERGKNTYKWADLGYALSGLPMPKRFEPISPGTYHDVARRRLCR